jgi:A/G-specific adenine glycosylase
VVGALLGWYDAERRDLPWRGTCDPYAILVSEVMLQQTQVARVVPRWEAWLRRWPTAESLAAAPLGNVLAAWVGLGYNRRAARLREACRAVADGGWPRDAAGLRALPGVGPYTAAAVASFAFGEPVACVDTNVRRVAERLGRGSPAELLAVVPPERAADWNQAMMDLGATVCGARAARCGACPVARWCRSRGAVAGRSGSAGPSGPAAAPRFEETNRWARGRVVASLAAGEGLPADVPAGRLERALDGLVRDGLVRRRGEGYALG